MSGAISSLPHTSSWRGWPTLLSTGTILLLYVRQMRSLILRKEHKLQVYENKAVVMRKISEAGSDEVGKLDTT
jgi:hypothetical protein